MDNDRDRHVRRSGDDYAEQFLLLLPQGQAWPRDEDSTLVRTCNGLSQYWGHVDSRAADLLETESDPRRTLEILVDWERAWGLPEKCLAEPQSIAERHAALITKMTLLGGQSRQWFIDLAKSIGYTITITEYAPFVTGISRCGDTTEFNPDTPTLNRWMLGPPENRFYWTVHVETKKIVWFRCAGSQCGDRLLTIGLATDLECLLRRYKPAHTEIVFDYSPLSATQQVGPPTIVNDSVYYAPSVLPGTATLGVPTFTNVSIFYAPSMTGVIGPALFTNVSVLYPPSLTYNIDPPLFTNVSTLFAPSLISHVAGGATMLAGTQMVFASVSPNQPAVVAPGLFVNLVT